MTAEELPLGSTPLEILEHHRKVNRMYDHTPELAADRLETTLMYQLGELGLSGEHFDLDEDGETYISFKYLDPSVVHVLVQAFMTGRMPQPDGRGSMFFSEYTAIGRQSALDTAIEMIRVSDPYDITSDPNFYPRLPETDI